MITVSFDSYKCKKMAASIVFFCLPLMQDYQSFQTWINEPDQSSYKPSVNSGNNYDDFYATMSAKYNENITQDDTDACGTYEYFALWKLFCTF